MVCSGFGSGSWTGLKCDKVALSGKASVIRASINTSAGLDSNITTSFLRTFSGRCDNTSPTVHSFVGVKACASGYGKGWTIAIRIVPHVTVNWSAQHTSVLTSSGIAFAQWWNECRSQTKASLSHTSSKVAARVIKKEGVRTSKG